jgi:ferric-dicitrate binding protein FerR (iron transport regulator)
MTLDCRQTQDSLGRWLDGELEADVVAALECHLVECDACRRQADQVRRKHEQLQAAFAPRRAAARQVANAVVAALPKEKPPSGGMVTSSRPTVVRRTVHLLLAAAAGFLVALLLFRPWEQAAVDGRRAEVNDGKTNGTDANPNSRDFTIRPAAAGENDIAQLSLATGSVEYAPKAGADFFACPEDATFESGAVLRTPASTRCEVNLEGAVRVRLNETTEMRLAGRRRLELIRGRLWLEVRSASEPYTVKTDKLTITAENATLDCRADPPQTTVLVLEGSASVQGDRWQEVVAQGEQLTVAGDERKKERPPVDPVVETRWVQNLLILKGADDEELSRRIDRLWAQVGRAKMTHLYESEIRSLGGRCVTPLACYIQSPESQKEHDRRVAAARLLADVAQVESIPELIELLSDEDGEVRFYAATALKRLTGKDFGRPPEDWQGSPWTTCQPTANQWQSWWQTAKGRYPGMKRETTPTRPPPQKKG